MGKKFTSTNLYLSPPNLQGGESLVRLARRFYIKSSELVVGYQKNANFHKTNFWDSKPFSAKNSFFNPHPSTQRDANRRQYWTKYLDSDGRGPLWHFSQLFYERARTPLSNTANKQKTAWKNNFSWRQDFDSDVVRGFSIGFTENNLLGGYVEFTFPNDSHEYIQHNFRLPPSGSGPIEYLVGGRHNSLFDVMRGTGSVEKGLMIAAHVGATGGISYEEKSNLNELSYTAPAEVLASICVESDEVKKLYHQMKVASERKIFDTEGINVGDLLNVAREPHVTVLM